MHILNIIWSFFSDILFAKTIWHIYTPPIHTPTKKMKIKKINGMREKAKTLKTWHYLINEYII